MSRFCWLILVLGLWACEEESATERRLLYPQEDNADAVESFGVEYLFSDSAKISMQLLAGHLVEEEQLDENGGKKGITIHYFDRGVEIYLYNDELEAHTTIKSDSAILDQKSGLLRLTGDVRMVNRRNERMRTEELIWNRSVDSVYTDHRVKIEMPDKIIIGREGLRSNTTFTAYSIFGIEGEMDAPDAQ